LLELFDFVGMFMMSLGLVLFLYGVFFIFGEGGFGYIKVLLLGFVGLVLMVVFVWYSFIFCYLLFDLCLFCNCNLMVFVIMMFIFVVVFFGGLLLVF